MKRSFGAHFRHLTPSRKQLEFFWSVVVNGPMVIISNLKLLFSVKSGKDKWLFSLDFHASVTKDLGSFFGEGQVRLIRRVISFHNRHFRAVFRLADPSPGVNATNWRRFTTQNIARFQRAHALLFSRIDGFVVSYPTSFIRLYLNLKKPILVVNPIRYEHPFSNRPDEWLALDEQLKSSIRDGRVTFIANNRADADYVGHSLGIQVQTAPSLCAYTNVHWRPNKHLRLSYAKYTSIAEELEIYSNSQWLGLRGALGKSFSWKQLIEAAELFYVPYAPSTMMLFEAATAGLPVAVPTLRFMNELRSRHPGVFSQLTFNQMTDSLPPAGKQWVASNHRQWDSFSEWWFDRSDFANRELMPNVRLVESFEQLLSEPSVPERIGSEKYLSAIEKRNEQVRTLATAAYEPFLSKL